MKRKLAQPSSKIAGDHDGVSSEDAFLTFMASANGSTRTQSIDPIIHAFCDMKRAEGNVIDAQQCVLHSSSSVSLTIPTFTSNHIQKLLYEPRDVLCKNGACVRIPACAKQSACIGSHSHIRGDIRGEAQPLGIWMTPDEYTNAFEHGMVPRDKRTCALCVSYDATFQYLRWRLQASACAPIDSRSTSEALSQPFCILVDEEGGYDSKQCIPFPNDSLASLSVGLFAPMMLPQLFRLESKYDSDGVRYICQKKVLSCAEPEPIDDDATRSLF
jgi:hypothetical protein